MDKKGNPVSDALVKYMQAGVEAGSDTTDEQGNFDFQAVIVTTGEEERKQGKEGLEVTGANPFTSQTKFTVSIEESADIRIIALNGQEVERQRINGEGEYEITWGGSNAATGVYIATMTTPTTQASKKLIVKGSNGQGLNVISHNSGFSFNYKSTTITEDSITFERENMTDIAIPAYGNDTTFTQILNVGMTQIEKPDTIYTMVNQQVQEELNQYYYNDDQNIYEPDIGIIVDDSIFQYTPTIAGITNVNIEVTDPEDATLNTSLELIIKASEQPQPPVANNDEYTGLEDEPGSVDAAANDLNVDPESLEITIQPDSIQVTNVANGVISFQGNPDWYGNDSLQYRIANPEGTQWDSAWVYMKLLNVNDAPFATNNFNSTYTVNEDQTIEIDLWEEIYFDIDNQLLSYPILNLQNASSTETDTSRLITPDQDWFGTITGVEINAYDGEYTAINNAFNIEVLPVNDYPNINNDTANTPYNTQITIDVLANDNDDKDPDGGIDASTLTITTPPTPEQGTAQVAAGQVEFTPTIGFEGQATFTYEVYDNGVPMPPLPGQATVYINVGQGNLPPTLNLPDTLFTQEDEPLPLDLLNLLNHYTDPEGQQGNFEITGQSNSELANLQVLQDTMLVLTYLQPNGYGTSTITIKADDGNGGEDIDDVVLKVNPTPDPITPAGTIPDQQGVEDEIWGFSFKPYYNNIDSVDVQIINATGLPNGFTYDAIDDSITVTPAQNWNGPIPGIEVLLEDAYNTQITLPFNLNMQAVPDPIQINGTVPNQNTLEEQVWQYDFAGILYNPDPANVNIINWNGIPGNFNVQTNGTNIQATPPDDWYGSLSDITITLEDEYNTQVVTNPFDWNIENVNDAPVWTGNIQNYNVTIGDTIKIINIRPDKVDDIDTPLLQYSVPGLTGTIQQLNGDEDLYIIPTITGTQNVKVKANDGEYSPESNQFNINVTEPMINVYLKVMDLMTDTLLTNSTLHVGSNTYNLNTGDTTIAITPGTYELNATHPNALDFKPRGPPGQFYPEYDAIQRPGQTSIVEQRAYNDQTSPVTFTTDNDTIHIYKVMEDFNMNMVTNIIGSGPQGQTHRFSDDDLNAPAWFDLNYTAPTQTTKDIVQYWLQELIPATNGRLNMQYQEGTTQPGTPYLQMAIDPSFSASNATSSNPNGEIIWCYARWPHNGQSIYSLGIEILQAVGDLNDISGIDPPIISLVNSQFVINHTGQECFHLLYNFNPGTRF